MRTIQGVSVSAGIAIGTVRVLAAVDYAVERRLIDDPQAEMDRFRAARDTAVAQLKQLRDNVAAEFGENKAELFDAHRLMLQDPDYAECVEGLIAQDKVNAEFAVKSAAEQFAAMFAAMDSSTIYGMNVSAAGMPFSGTPWGFLIIIILSIVVSIIAAIFLSKKKFF